jgi:hypothetical protein
MSQIRYLNYKEDDATWLLNSRWVGILEPAVYRGYDFVTRAANLLLVLEHGPTGIQPTAQDLSQTGRVRGVLLTKQGTIIMEDEPIQLEIQPGHFSLPRVDLVVCIHQHVQAKGGTVASYRVLVGVPGQGPPALTQPGKQTIVGRLDVPAGAVDMRNTGIIWTKNTAELAGRPPYKLPNTVAHWTKYQTWDKPQFFSGLGWKFMGTSGIATAAGVVTISTDVGVVFYVGASGDLTQLTVPANRRGEIFHLHFTAAARLVRGQATLDGSLLLPTADIVVNPGDAALFLILDDGSALLLHMQLGDPARLTQVNRYKRTQQQSKGGATVVPLPAPAVGVAKIDLDTNGNTYPLAVPTGNNLRLIAMTAMPEGTQVTLVSTQASRLPYSGDLNQPLDWGFIDYGSAATGYLPFQFPKPQDLEAVGALTAAPTAFNFTSHNGAWLLTSIANTLPFLLHDRQQLIQLPITGGSGFLAVPSNAGNEVLFHSYTTPTDGGKRDYLLQHTFVASVTGFLTLNVNFYRNGQQVHYYSFVLSDYQDSRLPYSMQWLFVDVLPGETLQVKLFRAQGSGSLKVDRSVATLDGTPSRSL